MDATDRALSPSVACDGRRCVDVPYDLVPVRIVFLSWRDLAHPQAGGSEYVVDRLATGLTMRGHTVTLLCAGPVGSRAYKVVETGGTYSQYVRTPWVARRLPRPDVFVDVENGIPFFAPLWTRSPVVCLVHHVHTEQWEMYFPKPIARIGSALEHHLMPVTYRRCPVVAVSPSTASELARLGVDARRVHTVVMGTDVTVSTAKHEAKEPMFLVLGRLVPHKRVDIALAMWDRVRAVVGGALIIAGDGPERDRLERASGPDVTFLGHVSDAERDRLLSEAWLLIHPAAHEGWGTVIMEAAAHSTPTIGFDVLGVRDSVHDGETGVLAETADAFVDAWTSIAQDETRRVRLGRAASRWAERQDWDSAVERFESVLNAAAAAPDDF